MPTIAVDAMGGDHAPDAVVQGVAQVSLATDIECLLVGDERRIQNVLEGVSYNPEHIAILHATEAIGMAEEPREAVKRRDASLLVGVRAVAEGRAEAFVSAGNTGACVLACAKHFRLLRGIRRPALARAARSGRAGAPPRRGRHGALRGRGAGALRAHGERLRAAHLQGREPRGRSPQHGERGEQGGRGAGRGAPPSPPAPGGQLRRQPRGQRPGARARRRDRVRGAARQRRAQAHRRRLRGALRPHQRGRRAARSVAARAPPPRGRHRAAAGAHRLHAVRRLADPGLRAALHQVPRALERARHRQRGQGGRQGGARPRAARDRRRAGGGAMRLGRARPGATPPASAAPLLCRWDLDKTYLRSEFDSLRSLLRTAFERAEDKVEVPGVAELIRALKAAAERRGSSALVYFVSASPPQIGTAIRKKLALDGVPYDGIVFKDQLAYLKRGKLRNLREHVGFKLAELLRGRLAAPPGAAELLFGDDWELDSLIYSLYADLVAGRLLPARLAPILRRIRVDPR